jgi:alkylation response protein AidB-like acyl-CoA dehydrogenase
VTGGADAQFMTALVDIEGRGPQMVVIDTDAPGVSLVRRFGTLDGSHHAAFVFHDVVVPVSHVIGGAGDGLGRALGQISDVRMRLAGMCIGTAAYVIDLLTEHLQAPRRRGEPLGAHERVRLRYGDLRIRTFAARSAVYRAARLIDSGENAVNEAIAAKVIATETVGDVVDAAIQLVGGEALVEGHPLERILRQVRALRLAEGETDTLRVNIARGRLDLGLGRI